MVARVDQQLTGPQSQQRNLYQPVTALTPSPGQIILGAVLLAVSTALTVAAAVTVARRVGFLVTGDAGSIELPEESERA